MKTIIWLDTINSTNAIAKKMANYRHGLCIAAKYQTEGRGQKGNIWQSGYGKNILATFCFNTSFTTQNHFCVSMITSIAIISFLKNRGVEAKIKWPNDIFVKNSKIAGILIENEVMGHSVERSITGIGLNVNQTAFSNLQNATSLQIETNLKYSTNKLIVELQKIIIETFNDYSANLLKLKKEYLKHLYAINGAYYKDKTETFRATISDIDFDGQLHLLTDKQEKRCYYFKEVRHFDEFPYM